MSELDDGISGQEQQNSRGPGWRIGLTLVGIAALAATYVFAKDDIRDYLTTDTGEAAYALVEKLQEEPNPAEYEKPIWVAAEATMQYLPDDGKQALINRTMAELSDGAKQDAIYTEMKALPDSVRYATIANIVFSQEPDMQASILESMFDAQPYENRADFLLAKSDDLKPEETDEMFTRTGARSTKRTLRNIADYLSEKADDVRQLWEQSRSDSIAE